MEMRACVGKATILFLFWPPLSIRVNPKSKISTSVTFLGAYFFLLELSSLKEITSQSD